jgi:hypothetical protein
MSGFVPELEVFHGYGGLVDTSQRGEEIGGVPDAARHRSQTLSDDPLVGDLEQIRERLVYGMDAKLAVEDEQGLAHGVDDRLGIEPSLLERFGRHVREGDHDAVGRGGAHAIRQRLAHVATAFTGADFLLQYSRAVQHRMDVRQEREIDESLREIANRSPDIARQRAEKRSGRGGEAPDAEPAIHEHERNVGAVEKVLELRGDARSASGRFRRSPASFQLFTLQREAGGLLTPLRVGRLRLFAHRYGSSATSHGLSVRLYRRSSGFRPKGR